MKRFAFLSGLVGLTLFGLLVAYSGFDDVAGAVASAGWATALVVAARAVAILAAALAWRFLFPVGLSVSAGVAVVVRFIREAVNNLLPVGQVGGDLVGARLLTFSKLDGALAGAVTIADVAVQAATQILFALVGVAILFALGGDSPIVRYAAGGLVVGVALVAAFFLLQARFGARWVSGVLRRLGSGRDWFGTALIERLWQRLGAVYASPARVAASAIVHLVVWFLGSVEVYVALHFMGHPVTVAEAIVIESLGQAVRGAAFVIPGGLGVQEGGYIALCGLFGVPPGPALALSLVKRVADLALGLPFLIVWQVMEGRRALRPRSGATARPLAESPG